MHIKVWVWRHCAFPVPAFNGEMAEEKNLPVGNRLSTPLGGVLITCAAMIVLVHVDITWI